MELLLIALIVTGVAKVVPAAIADAWATTKAASAGEWDLIDRDRARRATRGERWSQAWKAIRAKRHREAGGDGEFRPGAVAYARDVYQGFWEDKLKKRKVDRAARPEYVYDPDRKPWHVRFDDAVLDKAAKVRDRWGQYRTEREVTVVDQPVADSVPSEPVVHDPGTWTVGDSGEQMLLAPEQPKPAVGRATVPAKVPGKEPMADVVDGFQRTIDAELARRAALSPEDAAAEEAWRTRTNAAQAAKEEGLIVDPRWRRQNGFCMHRADGPRAAHGYCPGQICKHDYHGSGGDLCCYHTVAAARAAEARETDFAEEYIEPGSLRISESERAELRSSLFGRCGHRAGPAEFADAAGYCPNPAAINSNYCGDHAALPQVDPADREPNPNQTASATGGIMTTATATATEVNTNEDARRAFAAMAAAAAEAAEALAALEVARARMAAAAQGVADGLSAKAYDVGATSAANEAVDAIGLDTLSGWAEKIEVVSASAEQGRVALDKYLDSEAQVAEERIDPTVLASTSS